MSFKDQIINLIIQGRDLFSSEAEKSEKALADLALQSEQLNERLDDLGSQQAAIDAIDTLSAAIAKGESNYKTAAKALDVLVGSQKEATAEAKKLEQAQKAAAGDTEKLESAWQQAEQQLKGYDAAIKRARAKVAELSQEQQEGATASKAQAKALAQAKANLTELERAQSGAGQSAAELARELESSRVNLREVSAAAAAAADKKADYALEVKKARGELTSLGGSLTRNQRELEKQQAVLAKAGISMDELADASAELKQQQAAAEIALGGVNKRLEKHNRLLETSKKEAGDFGGSIKAATASLLAMAGAYVGIDRLWASLTGVLSQGDKAAAFTAQMTAMMGSIEAGEQATAWIKDFANNTGSQLDTVKQAFASLKAFGIDPMQGALQSMVDYNAKLGGSQENLEGIILAVGQAWAKQKLQGEEILQLVERGVPVWELLEQVTGKNSVALAKLSEQGKLGRDVIKNLFDEMGKQANGQAAKSLERLGGQLNVLSNKWQEFQQKIADSGTYQVAVTFLQVLNAKFDELNQSGKIQQAAQAVSDFFTALIRDGGGSLKTMLENISAFVSAMQFVAGSLQLIWNGITAGLSGLGAVSAKVSQHMLDNFARVVQFMPFVGKAVADAAREAASAMGAISEGYIEQIHQDGEDIRRAWDNILDSVSDSTQKSYQVAADIATESAQSQVQAAEKVRSAQDQQIDKAKELELAMAKAGITTVNSLKEQAEAAQETYEQVKDGAKQGIATAFEVEQAYKKWAEASIKVAQAQGQPVPEILKTEAAAQKLRDTLAGLIDKSSQLGKEQQAAGKFSGEYAKAIDNTKNAIEQLTRITQDSTVSDKDKAKAQEELGKRKVELMRQTLALKEVQDLETANYQELKAKQQAVITQLENLDVAYRSGRLTQQEYATEQEKLMKVLQLINAMTATYSEETVKAAESTENTTQTLRDQQIALEQLEKQMGRATEYTNLFAGAQAHLEKEFNLTSTGSEDLYKRLDDLTDMMARNARVTTGFWGELARASNEAFGREKEIIQATLRWRELMGVLDGGTYTLKDLKDMAYIAANNMSYLDEQSLATLNAGIEEARARLRGLRDDLSDTVDDLKEELDELNGIRKDAALKELENRREELRAKLAEAEAANDREAVDRAREALRLAEQIYQTKQRQARAEAAEAAKREQQRQTEQKQAGAAAANQVPTRQPQIPAPVLQQPQSDGQITTLRLVVGNQQFDGNFKRTVLAELMAEIRRQQQTGG
ncbi:tape measure protein [Shewanella sp. 3B26]|uniref:Tape measure protein n=1 Tax=Shewanella zhuhaiensis TaxID=2919576 RepID=A0AAJ1BGE8_9GAMM|nr:tape measure protein [Shewanella zhuhaiensis]MCH4294226.1 tape measure protein [Shewanella zhuhaiensis]